MRQTGLHRLCQIALLLSAWPAHSYNLYLSQNARTFDTQQSSLLIKGAAHACLALIRIPDSMPCNPAMLTKLQKPRIGVEALLSNGYATLEKMRRLLNGNVDQGTIDSLFGKDRVLAVEANGELDFISPYFAARYTPITVKYFSVVRNEANPDAEVSAVTEKNLTLQLAYPVSERLSLGLEAKNFSRRFIKQRLLLVELATDDGKGKLKPKDQKGFFVNPAATVFFPGALKPRASLMVANIGSVSGATEGIDEPVDVQGGLGISLPLGAATIEVDLDYRSLAYDESVDQKFHLGSLLHFGALTVAGGIDYYGASGGIYFGLDQVNSGILFTTTQVPWNSNDYYATTVYLQIGWQI